MSKKSFVHLHLHTAYSLLDGACRVGDVIDTLAELKMPGAAITDHGVMYGVIDFFKHAQAKGIRPIIGCEVYVATGSRHDRKGDSGKVPAHHLVLLATDVQGYHNLARLVSIAHIEGFYYKPRIDLEVLAKYHGNLIGLSACLKGEVASAALANGTAEATKVAGQYAEILGPGNFYIEVQDHGIPDQRKVNRLLVETAGKLGLPLVATNDVHYVKREHAAAHEVLLCLQTQTVMSDPKRMRYSTDQFYLKTREEMEQLFGEIPEALDVTLEIAERCNVEIDFRTLHFPTFHAPDGMDQKAYLVRLAHDGLSTLYGIPDPAHPRDARERQVMERFHSELAIIEHTHFINYFLVVWDFVNFAKRAGIPVGPGRGSGGGSVVAYALGITAIDPLRYNLIFERFLNPERVSPPDFDIDFCQARRGEVIEYVRQKYGRDCVAQIITFGSLGAKTVIRDVGRVLEIPYTKCDQLSKMVPDDPKITLKKALDQNPEFREAYTKDGECQRILDFGFVIEGLLRNPGTHAAGVVIGEKPLIEIIPLARDKDDEVITQYSMEPLGDLGLLKMDFLGLRNLTVIKEAIDLVKATRGVDIDLDKLPLDDKEAYALLNRGETVGIFQLESGGMRDLIRRIGINNIEDLIAVIALYRPGPMEMLPDYCKRKCGEAKIEYQHPLLEPILKETYGVMVYQEQVQQAANALAGYSLGEADILRRAMGKKKAEVMEQQRAKFVDGCKKKNHIPEKLAGEIFDRMAEFAGYGFNKAHSAGYGIIAYQTAYLKARFPEEFMAANLSSEIGNTDKLPVIIADARALGLAVLAPDVNTSRARFKPEKGSIRFGLAGIKNVGEGAAAAIEAERGRGGPFRTLVDFCSRVDSQLVNKKVIESLVRSGAFDSLQMHRARLFSGIDFAMTRATNAARDKRSGQGSLFDLMETPVAASNRDELPDVPPWHEGEMLAGERELLGFYLTGHPLTQYTALLNRYQLATVQSMAGLADGTATRVGGIVSTITKRFTKAKNEPMAIVQLEDLDGWIEAVVWPDALREYGMNLVQDAPVLMCGDVSMREDKPRLIAREIYRLTEVPRFFAARLSIHVPAAQFNETLMAELRELLRLHPGEAPVTVCLVFPAGEKVFLGVEKNLNVRADEELVAEIERRLGENSAFVQVKPQPCLSSHGRDRPRGPPQRRP